MYAWMLLIQRGISILFSLSHVSGSVFQAQSQVTWSDADAACQQENGTLFKPDKGSLDMQLFENLKLDEDLWVAATYSFVSDPETSFQMIELDSGDRCIAFEIRQDCTGLFWHKSCNETYNMICESYTEPGRQWILEQRMTWIAASNLCRSRNLKLATYIANQRQLFHQGRCEPGLLWTGSVIEVTFQSNMQPSYSQGACGFLQNHILSFGNCSSMMRPLCKRDWITQITSSDSDLTSATMVRRHTTYSLSYGFSVENMFSLSTTTQMGKDVHSISFQEETTHLSDTGVIIGSILSGSAFIFFIVLLVIIFRKRLTHGDARVNTEKEMNPDSMGPFGRKNPFISIVDPGMVLLQHGSEEGGNSTPTNNPETFNDNRQEETSKPGNSINFRNDINDDDNGDREMKVKTTLQNMYDSIHIEDDSYDHVEFEYKPGTVGIHVYDKANFNLRQERSEIQGSIACDTTGECKKPVDKSDGQHDKTNHIHFVDYNATHVIGSEKDRTSYHV